MWCGVQARTCRRCPALPQAAAVALRAPSAGAAVDFAALLSFASTSPPVSSGLTSSLCHRPHVCVSGSRRRHCCVFSVFFPVSSSVLVAVFLSLSPLICLLVCQSLLLPHSGFLSLEVGQPSEWDLRSLWPGGLSSEAVTRERSKHLKTHTCWFLTLRGTRVGVLCPGFFKHTVFRWIW